MIICSFPGCSSYEEGMEGSIPYGKCKLLPDYYYLPATGTVKLVIRTNQEWSIDSMPGWFIPSVRRGKGSDTIEISLAENTNQFAQEGLVKISTGFIDHYLQVIQESFQEEWTDGDLILNTQKKVSEFSTGHLTYHSGNLLIGNFSSGAIPPTGSIKVSVAGSKVYDVSSSDITDLSSLQKLISTEGLYIARTKLTQLPSLNKAIRLQDFYMGYCQLTNLDSLVNYPSLVYLSLPGNQITNISKIKELNYLERLDLSHNKISAVSALKSLNNLQVLNLAGNSLKDISSLIQLNNLTHLTLGESSGETNTISDVMSLYELYNLEYLDLSGLPIDISQISYLQMKLPGCTIIHENLKNQSLPEIRTDYPIRSGNSVTLSGTVVTTGKNTITECGFYYGTSDEFSKMTKVQGTRTGNTFTATMTGYIAYYIIAYAQTSDGKTYGEQIIYY